MRRMGWDGMRRHSKVRIREGRRSDNRDSHLSGALLLGRNWTGGKGRSTPPLLDVDSLTTKETKEPDDFVVVLMGSPPPPQLLPLQLLLSC